MMIIRWCDDDDNDDDNDDNDDDDDAPASGAPTPDQIKPGIAVLAARRGVYEEAVVVSPSKKKEGHFAVRFASDGKLIPKPIEELRITAEDGNGAEKYENVLN